MNYTSFSKRGTNLRKTLYLSLPLVPGLLIYFQIGEPLIMKSVLVVTVVLALFQFKVSHLVFCEQGFKANKDVIDWNVVSNVQKFVLNDVNYLIVKVKLPNGGGWTYVYDVGLDKVASSNARRMNECKKQELLNYLVKYSNLSNSKKEELTEILKVEETDLKRKSAQ